MFNISTTSLNPEALKTPLNDAQAGALVTFEGWIRNHNKGQSVASLEYEAHTTLALKEGTAILQEAHEKFDLQKTACVHRIGHLQIGDLAVWVGVTSAHRDAAFQASRYIIDEVKQRVPIWKKEHYTNQQTRWLKNGKRPRRYPVV